MKDIELIVSPEALLIPGHRLLEALHRISTAINDRALGPDQQTHLASLCSDMFVFDDIELAGNHRKQIAGSWLRIDKPRPVAPMFEFSPAIRVATGEQHRKASLIGAQGHAIAGQDIGAVHRPGDMAKALRLALAEQKTLL
jgi:hypothetical protein